MGGKIGCLYGFLGGGVRGRALRSGDPGGRGVEGRARGVLWPGGVCGRLAPEVFFSFARTFCANPGMSSAATLHSLSRGITLFRVTG